MNFIKALAAYLIIIVWGPPLHAQQGKATEGKEVVLNKLYPKEEAFEFSAGGGLIMNQSYLSSYYGNIGGAYFPDEYWGLGLKGLFILNQDNGARHCIETFYNDPNESVEPECLAEDLDESIRTADDANIGPAYVPIRELESIVTADFLWNPIYGKQIVLLSQTSYFDLQVSAGGGLAMSKFYELRTHIRGQPGKSARGTLPSEENPDSPDVGTTMDETDEQGSLFGVDGRPTPKRETTPTTSLGLTQRFHFAKRFSLTFDFHNYTLLGTERGLETYFTIGSSFGLRF